MKCMVSYKRDPRDTRGRGRRTQTVQGSLSANAVAPMRKIHLRSHRSTESGG